MRTKVSRLHSLFKKPDILIFLLFLLFLPIFFYNLGGFSLIDFDEAWYAEIARNILISKNPLVMSFNNAPFSDHPPFGFLLMATSFIFFGFNEFAARLPSALFAFVAVWATYLLGKSLFNRAVGICASFMLMSSVWFIFRARSGNLDTIFLGLFMLSFYFATRIKKDKQFLWFFCISFACLLLTKTLIGITLLFPVISYFFISKTKIKLSAYIKAVVLIGIIVLPWLIANYLKFGPWFIQHIFLVGARTNGYSKPNFADLLHSLTFLYLHFGIRKWYYLFLLSFIGNLVFVIKHRSLIPLYTILLVFFAGFLTNEKTEIWHLIPLYPFIGLMIGFFVYQVITFSLQLIRIPAAKYWGQILTITIISIFASWQFYFFRNEVKLFDKDISGLAGSAQAAQGREEKLYLYADYFLPSAVFYSQKQVTLVKGEDPPKNTLVGIIDYGEKPFLLLTERWKLELDQIPQSKYQTLKEHKEYMLLYIPK